MVFWLKLALNDVATFNITSHCASKDYPNAFHKIAPAQITSVVNLARKTKPKLRAVQKLGLNMGQKDQNGYYAEKFPFLFNFGA